MTKRKSMGGGFSMCVQPAFIIGTYNDDGTPNFAPITWVSVTWDTDHYMLVISMFGSKKTKENIAKTNALSANLVSCDMLELLDFFGTRSGKDGAKQGLEYTYGNGETLSVPTLDASKWVYECEVAHITQTGDSDTYFCDIKNVQIDENADITNGIDLTQFDPVVYSGNYHSIKEKLGAIGDFYSNK
jgi:Conserved protein/domain typically associated with flavoprotein oxygenases, DIM6/NTAB family